MLDPDDEEYCDSNNQSAVKYFVCSSFFALSIVAILSLFILALYAAPTWMLSTREHAVGDPTLHCPPTSSGCTEPAL
jgi:hypothetical protein